MSEALIPFIRMGAFLIQHSDHVVNDWEKDAFAKSLKGVASRLGVNVSDARAASLEAIQESERLPLEDAAAKFTENALAIKELYSGDRNELMGLYREFVLLASSDGAIPEIEQAILDEVKETWELTKNDEIAIHR